ncbi:hypothetical protein J2741_001262 [Methanolinea mesophila]|uniref:hypothetical protein n=1 Tax=Methanolinea mesophila TaxID=547055 RepID=UPI001FD831BC|nr:hypothetical protein [Methanolinea mesophila]MBP1928715.1 hypothetical protein [Methanolinea mesophila]
MKRITSREGGPYKDYAVTTMHEYLIISGILLVLMVIMTITLTAGIISPPIQHLKEYSYIDIGNGVSTRIVDLYVIAPNRGNITTKFDIPDDVAGEEYFVLIGTGATGDQVSVFKDTLSRNVSLAGIGSTLRTGGYTTGHGLNQITYRSEAFP